MNVESIQRELDISNLDNVCIDGCGCNEVVPDVEGPKLDMIATKRAIQVSANALDVLKCELVKISDRRNNFQNQLENEKTIKVTKASPSPPKYLDFEHVET